MQPTARCDVHRFMSTELLQALPVVNGPAPALDTCVDSQVVHWSCKEEGDALRAERVHSKKYHKPSDELDGTWDFGGILQDAQAFFHAGFDLANDTRYPNWRIDNRFRPLRDAMVRPR